MCCEYKLVEAFNHDSSKPTGLQSACKDCAKIKRLAYYNNTKEEHSYRHRLKTYGLTRRKFEILLAQQNNVCAICGNPPKATNNRNQQLCVDHNHTTGEIRGLLCSDCNTGIGGLRDNPDILRKAIAYLNPNRRSFPSWL